MKVLMINGSPHKEGNTYIALKRWKKFFPRKALKVKSYR